MESVCKILFPPALTRLALVFTRVTGIAGPVPHFSQFPINLTRVKQALLEGVGSQF